MEFHVAGELNSILTPLVERVLTTTYESRDIKFEPPFIFRKEEGVKVINGIVKIGEIPKGTKPNQNISAAQNFGFGLMIMKKSAERKLDISENPYVQDIWNFIDDKLSDDGQTMKMETLYKEDDFAEFSAGDPRYLSVKGIDIPYVVFENHDDVTTGRGEALGNRLEARLATLWDLYVNRP